MENIDLARFGYFGLTSSVREHWLTLSRSFEVIVTRDLLHLIPGAHSIDPLPAQCVAWRIYCLLKERLGDFFLDDRSFDAVLQWCGYYNPRKSLDLRALFETIAEFSLD